MQYRRKWHRIQIGLRGRALAICGSAVHMQLVGSSTQISSLSVAPVQIEVRGQLIIARVDLAPAQAATKIFHGPTE